MARSSPAGCLFGTRHYPRVVGCEAIDTVEFETRGRKTARSLVGGAIVTLSIPLTYFALYSTSPIPPFLVLGGGIVGSRPLSRVIVKNKIREFRIRCQ